jgi:ubiquinone/menaquinone biosynthesis C-methylase UbiE
MSSSMIKLGEDYCKGINCEWRLTNNNKITRPLESVNYIYSILTIQHLHSIEDLHYLLTQFYNLLYPQGYCRFQFSNNNRKQPKIKSEFDGLTLSQDKITNMTQDLKFKVIDYKTGLGNESWDWITLQK